MSIALAVIIWRSLAPRQPSEVPRLTIAHVEISPYLRAIDAQLSPDGRTEVLLAEPLVAPRTRVTLLCIGRVDGGKFEPIQGSEDARDVTFSPDGKWIAFSTPLLGPDPKFQLFKVRARSGATPTLVMDWDARWDGAPIWRSSDEMIVAVDHGREFQRVPMGGEPMLNPHKIQAPGYEGEMQFASWISDTEAAFMIAQFYEGCTFHSGIGVLDVRSGRFKLLLKDGGNPRCVDTHYLVYTREGTLYAAPFDSRRRALVGKPMPILGGLRTVARSADATFQISRNGMLQTVFGSYEWRDRGATTVPEGGASRDDKAWNEDRKAFEEALSVSPDGHEFVTQIANPKNFLEIWLSQRDRPWIRRVIAVLGADVRGPTWSPSGAQIAYGVQSLGEGDGIYVANVNGTGAPQRVALGERGLCLAPTSWSPDGKQLLCVGARSGKTRLFMTPASPTGTTVAKPIPVFADTVQRGQAAFSPDGRLIAYEAELEGRAEAFVCAWSDSGPLGDPVRVSTSGGEAPRWSPDGKRLFFCSADRLVMSARITSKPRPSLETVVAWDLDELAIAGCLYDILPDGRLLAIRKGYSEDQISSFSLARNFVDDLKRIAAAGWKD